MPLSRLSPDEVDFIMKAKEVQYSNCEIAQRLGVTEGAIRYWIKRRLSGERDGRQLKPSALDRYHGVIAGWIEDYKDSRRRPTLKALCDTLKCHHGYDRSYDAVRRYVRKHFPEFWKRGFRIRIETPPGKLLQLDWKEDLWVQMTEPGNWIKVQALVFSLGFSRKSVVKISERKDLDSFIHCHQGAFLVFGGLPEVIRTDCLKSAIVQWRGQSSKINVRYQKFLDALGVVVFPSRPGTPEDKGKVEKRILDLFSRLDLRHRVFKDMADLERQVNADLGKLSQTWRCGATGLTVAESFTYEQQYLRPLPESFPQLPLKEKSSPVRRDGTVYFDGNYYQLPREYRDHAVLCMNTGTEILIYHNGRVIGHFPYLPQAKGMVMLSEEALQDEEVHISDTVRAWSLEVARRQVAIYQDIIGGGTL